IITTSYNHTEEGDFNLSIEFNTTETVSNPIHLSNLVNFSFDLYAPEITLLSFNYTEGFESINATVNFTCTDFTEQITYNITFNTDSLYFDNITQGTKISNVTTYRNGNNTLTGACLDFWNTTTQTNIYTLIAKTLWLIDEKDNTGFDPTNITGARAYYDDNRTFFDFKDAGVSNASFVSSADEKLRIELTYTGGVIITRWVDIGLITGENIRVCANKEGVTHYEQLIIAATSKPAILTSVFSDCIVAADYTRFAYQDSLLLKGYTTETLYYLKTIVDGSEVILASVDGSLESYINLDQLDFLSTAFTLNILGDGLAFEASDDPHELRIYYRNVNEDNTALNLDITRLDTDTLVLSTSTFT
ncbi:unnamed protein product, partial [marine sediment metagenome]